MSSEQEPTHISMKEAVKLAGWKPAKKQTRKDLLVYGGWLTSRWEWSRDVDVSLDQAIANSRRLGEDVRIVGNPKLADRKMVRGRKQPEPVLEPVDVHAPEKPSALPVVSESPTQREEPLPHDDTEPEDSPATEELPAEAGVEETTNAEPSPPEEPSKEKTTAPSPHQGSRVLLERFLIASALCSVALFLGYFGLAGSLYVYILLMADAFFIVASSILALKNRRNWGGTGRETPVKAHDVATGK